MMRLEAGRRQGGRSLNLIPLIAQLLEKGEEPKFRPLRPLRISRKARYEVSVKIVYHGRPNGVNLGRFFL